MLILSNQKGKFDFKPYEHIGVECLDKLFNNQNISELKISTNEDDAQIMPLPSMEEGGHGNHRLENHKSPGTAEIIVELFKCGSDQLHQAAIQLMLKV